MTDIYLIEATSEYAEQVWQFRQEVFDTYDFSGKTIIPFNTHAGSGDGGTYNTIRELEPNADVKEGLAVSGSSVFDEETKQQVKDRLLGLD